VTAADVSQLCFVVYQSYSLSLIIFVISVMYIIVSPTVSSWTVFLLCAA